MVGAHVDYVLAFGFYLKYRLFLRVPTRCLWSQVIVASQIGVSVTFVIESVQGATRRGYVYCNKVRDYESSKVRRNERGNEWPMDYSWQRLELDNTLTVEHYFRTSLLKTIANNSLGQTLSKARCVLIHLCLRLDIRRTDILLSVLNTRFTLVPPKMPHQT